MRGSRFLRSPYPGLCISSTPADPRPASGRLDSFRPTTTPCAAGQICVAAHTSRMRFCASEPTLRLTRWRMLYPIAKPSLLLNVPRNPWRAGRGIVAQSRLYFLGYVTAYPSEHKRPPAVHLARRGRRPLVSSNRSALVTCGDRSLTCTCTAYWCAYREASGRPPSASASSDGY
jgi:hypothetical protein